MSDLRVGFVGLGDIGKPMALHLAASSVDLTVFDLVPSVVAELVAAGACGAGSVAELAAASDVVCVVVNTDAQVRSVVAEALPALAAGSVILVHSTLDPATPGELAEVAAASGVSLLDAPVSGGAMGAGDATLALLVGGDVEAFRLAKPVLEILGAKVVHAGPIGAGTQFKLARNLMHYAAFTAATEAQRLAEAAGLDLAALGEVVRHTDAITGGPGAIMHRDTTAPLEQGDFWYAVFTHVATLAHKDLDAAIALADELGVDVPMARLARKSLAPGLGLPTQED